MNREDLQKEIDSLKARISDMERALPAHSIRPHQLLAIEELEDLLQEKLNILNKSTKG